MEVQQRWPGGSGGGGFGPLHPGSRQTASKSKGPATPGLVSASGSALTPGLVNAGGSQMHAPGPLTSDVAIQPPELIKWIVQSLYLDEAVPRGPLLQWMVQLLVGVKLNHRQLRNLLLDAKGVSIEPFSAKKLNFTAVLGMPPPEFQGFVSEQDVSPEVVGEELWEEVTKAFAHGGWPLPDDVGHKYYVVALWLQDRSDMLRQLSFGRLLSFVRTGLVSAGLLGHRGGYLVPYAQSEECERRVNAVTGQPTAVAPDESYVKDWDELRSLLNSLISKEEKHLLEVCKIKASIRSQFQTELSETVFGHQSLSRLLSDPLLGDDFVLGTAPGSNRYMLGSKAITPDLKLTPSMPRDS
eukprot:TRINITY_DN32509_c0_g1_i1.p2 TRINITY_DN32509_c0_g1~~TRINITY_DN32509_c0_g1_i1.p2  ORF type:complete len:354 (+),score=90.46 TRINITY_DN32509_c0_g1_i1:169-1230(+)